MGFGKQQMSLASRWVMTKQRVDKVENGAKEILQSEEESENILKMERP